MAEQNEEQKEEQVLEGEVHNMDELKGESAAAGDSVSKDLQGASPVWKALSVLVFLMAVAYDLSPIDAIPDAVPLVGLLDDVGFTLMAILNLYQQFAKDQNFALVKFARYIKWALVALIVLAGILFGGLITLIVHLVAQS